MYAHRGNALAEILSTYKRAQSKQHAGAQHPDPRSPRAEHIGSGPAAKRPTDSR